MSSFIHFVCINWFLFSIIRAIFFRDGFQSCLPCWPLNCLDLSLTLSLDARRRYTRNWNSHKSCTWIGMVQVTPLEISFHIIVYFKVRCVTNILNQKSTMECHQRLRKHAKWKYNFSDNEQHFLLQLFSFTAISFTAIFSCGGGRNNSFKYESWI